MENVAENQTESRQVDACDRFNEMDLNGQEKSEHIKADTDINRQTVDDRADDSEGKITREDIALPKDFERKLAFVLRNVCTPEECAEYIKKTEKMGYTDALVNVGGGRQQMMKDVRNNTRCIWDSFEEADKIWQRIKQYIPEVWKERNVMGLNERLRFLRYDVGEYFAPHMDGMYRRENGERSYITVQLYLNEGFEGGSTTFMDYSEEERMEVVPETGMVLVFQHDIMHEGSLLKKGRKYAMRTDIMYSATDYD